jgi:hypothetical protein
VQSESPQKNTTGPAQRHTWPWFVLAALILAIVLAVLWLSFEIAKTKRIRDLNAPTSQPNPSPAPQTNDLNR